MNNHGACSSNNSKNAGLCKNDTGDLLHGFCFHTIDMHCHLGSNPRLTQKYKTYAYFERSARQNAWKKSAPEGISDCKSFQNLVEN